MTEGTCKVVKHDIGSGISFAPPPTPQEIIKELDSLTDDGIDKIAKNSQQEIIQRAIIDIVTNNKNKEDYSNVIDDVRKKVDIINKLTRINK